MLITMFTDASFHHKLKRGTWAMWAKGDGNTLRYSGIIKNLVPNSCVAELAAIANGLFVVARQIPGVSHKIIVQTDSLESITAIKKGTHPRGEEQTFVTHIIDFAHNRDLTLDLRHVKGHRGDATPRNAVNTWCDGEAKRQMGLLLVMEKENGETVNVIQLHPMKETA